MLSHEQHRLINNILNITGEPPTVEEGLGLLVKLSALVVLCLDAIADELHDARLDRRDA